MSGVATSTTISMNAALAESQQQFDMIKRTGGVNRLMGNATVTSTRPNQQQLLQQQLNSQAQGVHSQVTIQDYLLKN